jgi:hypothetical protein
VERRFRSLAEVARSLTEMIESDARPEEPGRLGREMQTSERHEFFDGLPRLVAPRVITPIVSLMRRRT